MYVSIFKFEIKSSFGNFVNFRVRIRILNVPKSCLKFYLKTVPYVLQPI
jgi:hypothetical protein